MVLHDWGDDECIQILRYSEEIPEEIGEVIIAVALIKENPDAGDKHHGVGVDVKYVDDHGSNHLYRLLNYEGEMEMGEETKTGSTTAKEESQAQLDIWRYVFGFTEMAAVKCAIELGIADAMEKNEGPMTIAELSSAVKCPPYALYRIMRFLIHRGIFKEESKSTTKSNICYVQTPLSRLLATKGENSMAAFVLLESSPVMLAPWHGLSTRVMNDKNAAFAGAHGEDVWHYASRNPAHSKLIDDAMACNARMAARAIIAGCPEVFSGLNSVVDVGGGNGTALGMFVKAFPWIRGINFDLPHVVSVAPLCDCVEHVGGDMFVSVPNADAAFIMCVLHDWGDDECIQILKNCKQAIPHKAGKVIIVEAVIDEDDVIGDKLQDVGLMLDMVMMAHTNNGKERNLKEWAHVLTGAGFSRYTVKRIQAVQSVIEAYP